MSPPSDLDPIIQQVSYSVNAINFDEWRNRHDHFRDLECQGITSTSCGYAVAWNDLRQSCDVAMQKLGLTRRDFLDSHLRGVHAMREDIKWLKVDMECTSIHDAIDLSSGGQGVPMMTSKEFVTLFERIKALPNLIAPVWKEICALKRAREEAGQGDEADEGSNQTVSIMEGSAPPTGGSNVPSHSGASAPRTDTFSRVDSWDTETLCDK